MLIAALLFTAPNWKQPKYLTAGDYINNLVYPYNGLLFSSKKVKSSNICNMGKSQNIMLNGSLQMIPFI